MGFPIGVTIYRKVRHRTAKNFQLDLSQRRLLRVLGGGQQSFVDRPQPAALHGGRRNHEKTIGQLKSGLAVHTVRAAGYAANSAWQQLVALTHNLLTNSVGARRLSFLTH